ncbi:hypothetical protein ACMD2_24263 [Ananas comosus]|uniref:Uncharacterized protein n=1 Tax=Ananas comosus TaxID=4615 RepID=A0A199W8F8_ANACO|nr:hypothetical protein ACMD2_24263 [Ananas comosus]
MWKTRAKQRWLKEGDGNTKFFHAVANGRKRVNSIEVIEDNGRYISREEQKRSYFLNKFKQLFCRQDMRSWHHGDWSELYKTSRVSNPELLTAPFSMEEVKTATY